MMMRIVFQILRKVLKNLIPKNQIKVITNKTNMNKMKKRKRKIKKKKLMSIKAL